MIVRIISGLAFVALFAGSIVGCNPYQFNMGYPHEVRCQVITSLASVDQGYDAATLHNTGAIDMNYFGATQYLITMDMKLVRGEGFRMLLRPVVEQTDVRDSGIVLTVTRSGVWLDSANRIFLTRKDVRLSENNPVPVSLLSDDNYMQVVLGCDTVYRGWSKKKESDDIVIQALPKSDVQIIQPDWAGLPDR